MTDAYISSHKLSTSTIASAASEGQRNVPHLIIVITKSRRLGHVKQREFVSIVTETRVSFSFALFMFRIQKQEASVSECSE